MTKSLTDEHVTKVLTRLIDIAEAALISGDLDDGLRRIRAEARGVRDALVNPIDWTSGSP